MVIKNRKNLFVRDIILDDCINYFLKHKLLNVFVIHMNSDNDNVINHPTKISQHDYLWQTNIHMSSLVTSNDTHKAIYGASSRR